MARYQISIIFTTDEDVESEQFDEMVTAAYVQVQDAEGVDTSAVVVDVSELDDELDDEQAIADREANPEYEDFCARCMRAESECRCYILETLVPDEAPAGLYAITATVTRETADGWTSSRQVPTFYLNPNVQGIVDEAHAQRIALDIIDPWNTGQVIVTAVRL